MSKCVKCGNEILTGDIHWEMGLCNNCYNELYKDHKTHISLDKMWLKLAQDFRDEKEKEVKELQEQLALTEKALELACERVKYFEEMQDKEMGFSEFFGYDSDYDLQAIIEQYKEQAKEKESE